MKETATHTNAMENVSNQLNHATVFVPKELTSVETHANLIHRKSGTTNAMASASQLGGLVTENVSQDESAVDLLDMNTA